MYSISSLTSGQQTTSKAIGGLATGLDTAELLKNMTVGTRSKIAKQQQTKQLLTWQTEAYRGISDKLINFSRKYTSFTSSSNLLSESFYTSSNLTTSGSNASKISVSGTSPMAGEISIVSATTASAGGALSVKELTVDTDKASATAKLSEISPTDPPITDFSLNIGGHDIVGLTADSTIQDVVNAINLKTADTGVAATYDATLGRFKFTTNDGNEKTVAMTGGLSTALLGFSGDLTIAKSSKSQIQIKFGDTGSIMNLEGDTNEFKVDGLTIKINDSFSTGDAVKLNTAVNTDVVFNSIKDMIKDYNDIIETLNKEYSTKRNRDFPPLSNEQRKELSETEAKAWDEKAKAGMLFGNSDIGNLKNDLRAVFFSDSSAMSQLKEIGITPSTEWKDGGRIVLDEEKLKKAISENPENVKTIFSKPKSDTDSGGFMLKLKDVTDKYAKTEGSTKGVLIEKAGSTFSPLSMTKNKLLEQSQRVDKIIASLNRTLANEETRYQKQFTNLETVYARMNAQAGWLTQQFGG